MFGSARQARRPQPEVLAVALQPAVQHQADPLSSAMKPKRLRISSLHSANRRVLSAAGSGNNSTRRSAGCNGDNSTPSRRSGGRYGATGRGSMPRRRPGRRGAGETVNALAAFAIVHVAETYQCARLDAGLLARLAAGGLLQVGFALARLALGDAPGGAAVVRAGWVDQQHFQAPGPSRYSSVPADCFIAVP